MRFWLSWVQVSNDMRPLTYPPNEAIMGWWCSGYDSDDNYILCAVVDAADAEAAKAAIARDWPEAADAEWRFCEPQSPNWRPAERFPLSPWMQKRFSQPVNQ